MTDTPDANFNGHAAPTVERLEVDLLRWQAMARKHEERAAATQAEIDNFDVALAARRAEAVAAATATGRAEAMKLVGHKLAAAALRVAVTGRVADVDTFLSGIDPSKFLGEDGDVDVERVAAWADRFPMLSAAGPVVRRDLGVGPRGEPPGPAVESNPLVADLKHILGVD
jgi:hypothetical protein